ncbi:MAG: C40 family peptidase [Desulfobulbaceae bacterium]|jgi:probable lipoprotein NlpC|nr:C40 family peptidase [Desulfobulbaceae bacterium]
MKKYLAFTLPFFVTGLLLLPPEVSQAHISPKKNSQMHPVKLTNASRIIIEPGEGKGKEKVVNQAAGNKATGKTTDARHKVGRKSVKSGKFQVASRGHKGIAKMRAHHASQASTVLADDVSLDALRQHYQDWRGTRYRLGGSSRAGVDCSGFAALTFRDLYGIKLPRTAHEQATQGIPVNRGSLLPGDLVFFKRGHGGINHVGIYIGHGQFMHASSSQGVSISSMNDDYWRNKFWKGSRLL